MTGPEHYREAEKLLKQTWESELTTYEGDNLEADRMVAAAQVHATLALAAATALATMSTRASTSTVNAWHDAAGKPNSEGDA